MTIHEQIKEAEEKITKIIKELESKNDNYDFTYNVGYGEFISDNKSMNIKGITK